MSSSPMLAFWQAWSEVRLVQDSWVYHFTPVHPNLWLYGLFSPSLGCFLSPDMTGCGRALHIYSLHFYQFWVSNFCFTCHPLHKETSLRRSESYTNLGVKMGIQRPVWYPVNLAKNNNSKRMRDNSLEQRQLLSATPLKKWYPPPTMANSGNSQSSQKGEGCFELLSGSLWNVEETKLVKLLCRYPQLWAHEYNAMMSGPKRSFLQRICPPSGSSILSASIRWGGSHEGPTTLLMLWSFLYYLPLLLYEGPLIIAVCNTNLFGRQFVNLII